jgi:hypothetical protein
MLWGPSNTEISSEGRGGLALADLVCFISLFASSAKALTLQGVIGAIRDHLPVIWYEIRLPVLAGEVRRYDLWLQNDAAALDVGDIPLSPVPSDRELGARKLPGLIHIRVIGYGFEIVEVLTA